MSFRRLFAAAQEKQRASNVVGAATRRPAAVDRGVGIFRIFGSPYSSVTHQHITYLFLKRLPMKTYCGTFASTKLYSVFYAADSVFCALTLHKECCLLPWHLMERVERCHNQVDRTDGDDDDVASQKRSSGARLFQHARKILLERKTHPQLHMLSWLFMAYGNWWLTLTGMMYRWVHSDAEGIVSGYMNYFLLMSSIGVVGPLRERFRKVMCGLLEVHGVSEASRPFMVEHFELLCDALDAHFRALDEKSKATATSSSETASDESKEASPLPNYLLDTPHPTIADVAIGSVFSGYFLLDANTVELMEKRHPHLLRYLSHVAGFQQLKRGEFIPEPPSDAEEAREASEFPDAVPESLKPVLMLMEDVFPFLADQCEAFRTFMSGERALKELKRITLDEYAEGDLHGLEAYVLQQRTPISTVMLVDRHLLTMYCRAQDIEIATTAAREVLDVELAPFNKADDPARNAAVGGDAAADAVHLAHAETLAARDRTDITISRSGGAMELHRMEPISIVERLKTGKLELTDVLRSGVAVPFPPPDYNDEASLPHVFSSKGGRDFHRFGSYQSSLEVRRSQRSLQEVLASLYQLLWQMHCPQFTLSAVSQNRRVFVAVIPEHEYAKKRLRDASRVETPAKVDIRVGPSQPL